MLKKIINYLRDKKTNRLTIMAVTDIVSAIARKQQFEKMEHLLREEKIKELLDDLYTGKLPAKEVRSTAGDLVMLFSAHVYKGREAWWKLVEENRALAEQLRQEKDWHRMDVEQERILQHVVNTHKRVLLENQTLFSKEEWLARAAKGKRYPHSDDEFLGVPDDVIEEAKAAFEHVKHEHSEIVRHNGPYMITVTEDGVTILKDVLAGVGGIEECQTFEPITATQRKWDAAVRARRD